MILGLLLQASLSLCEGRIQDKLPHPQALKPKPPIGEWVSDEVFGTRLMRITNAEADPDGHCRVIKPAYSTVPSWNADGSLMILWHRCRGHEIYEGRPPFRFIRSLGALSPTDLEQVWWDPTDWRVVYYPTSYVTSYLLLKQRVDGPITIQYDFGNYCRGEVGQLTAGSDPVWIGRGPLGLVGLRCGQRAFLYSLKENVIEFDFFSAILDGFSRTVMASLSDRFILYDRNVFQVRPFEYQVSLGMRKFYEHASLGMRSDGVDVWNTVDFDDLSPATLKSWRLDTGEVRTIIGQSNGWPYPPGSTHISSTYLPDWVAIGIVGNGEGQLPLHGEVLLANVLTGEVCRIAHHRSTGKEGAWGYWAETHLNMDPTGKYIAIGSDWHNGPSVDTYIVEIR